MVQEKENRYQLGAVLSDQSIIREVREGRIVIEPYDPKNVRPASYDFYLGNEFLVFERSKITVIDPKEPTDNLTKLVSVENGDFFVLHPQEFILGVTKERLKLPHDIVARLEGLSSLGRLGIVVHATAGYIDPGWDGRLTVEIHNVISLPVKLYPGMPFGQFSFYRLDAPADNPYRGSYQGDMSPRPSQYWRKFQNET